MFSHHRDCLLAGAVAGRFTAALLALLQVEGLLLSEHPWGNGAQMKVWASMKNIRRCDGSAYDNGTVATGRAFSARWVVQQRDACLDD